MFKCNITGKLFDLDNNDKGREQCHFDGYNSRMRAICFVFTKLFYEESRVLSSLQINKNLKGIGMSDSAWSKLFEDKFNYTNTYYHKKPFLNIYDEKHVKTYTNLDFCISSDVFEHINPLPGVQIAFNNVNKMLKLGGKFIFSVPYSVHNEHVEHYPNLNDYEIIESNGDYVLENITIEGEKETFTNLVFHGGPGSTLEMRVFSKKSIEQFLTKSGFDNITFHSIDDNMFECGIFWDVGAEECSLIVSATKAIQL